MTSVVKGDSECGWQNEGCLSLQVHGYLSNSIIPGELWLLFLSFTTIRHPSPRVQLTTCYSTFAPTPTLHLVVASALYFCSWLFLPKHRTDAKFPLNCILHLPDVFCSITFWILILCSKILAASPVLAVSSNLISELSGHSLRSIMQILNITRFCTDLGVQFSNLLFTQSIIISATLLPFIA